MTKSTLHNLAAQPVQSGGRWTAATARSRVALGTSWAGVREQFLARLDLAIPTLQKWSPLSIWPAQIPHRLAVVTFVLKTIAGNPLNLASLGLQRSAHGVMCWPRSILGTSNSSNGAVQTGAEQELVKISTDSRVRDVRVTSAFQNRLPLRPPATRRIVMVTCGHQHSVNQIAANRNLVQRCGFDHDNMSRRSNRQLRYTRA